MGKCSGLAWPPPLSWESNPLALPNPSPVGPKAILALQWPLLAWVILPITWLSLGLVEISASWVSSGRGRDGAAESPALLTPLPSAGLLFSDH